MTAWWHVKEDKQYGPVEKDNLTQLIQAGMIGPKKIFWKIGMESWLLLDQIEELHGLKSVLPSKVSSPLTYLMASRWPRFFARTFDLGLEGLFVFFLLGFTVGFLLALLDDLSGQHSAGFIEWLNGPFVWVNGPFSGVLSGIFFLLCTLIGLILDALLHQLIGNTPRKALL